MPPVARVLVELDADAVELVADALRADSVRRQRAATRAAAELHTEREAGRKDIRSGAVMVTNLLVDAARLDDAAKAVEQAQPKPELRIVEDPLLVAARDAVLDFTPPAPQEAAPMPTPPPAPLDDDAAGVRTPAEALAETRSVIADLGLNITREDIEGDDDELLDGRLPEDDPGAIPALPAELADLAPQDA